LKSASGCGYFTVRLEKPQRDRIRAKREVYLGSFLLLVYPALPGYSGSERINLYDAA
jgi:hypothetical protein